VALRDLVAVLVAHWGDTLPHLEPGDRELIADAISRMGAAKEDAAAANAAVADLTTLLVVRLPPGHAVREVIAEQTRLAIAPDDLPRIASALQVLALGVDAQPRGLSPMTVSAQSMAGQSAEARLLSAPALTPEQVRDSGGDPNRDDLIRLAQESGAVQLPAFQFGQDGAPVPVVSAINRLLQVASDPWGVADWWLGANAWLDAVPADLIGRVADDLLTRAAQADFPGS